MKKALPLLLALGVSSPGHAQSSNFLSSFLDKLKESLSSDKPRNAKALSAIPKVLIPGAGPLMDMAFEDILGSCLPATGEMAERCLEAFKKRISGLGILFPTDGSDPEKDLVADATEKQQIKEKLTSLAKALSKDNNADFKEIMKSFLEDDKLLGLLTNGDSKEIIDHIVKITGDSIAPPEELIKTVIADFEGLAPGGIDSDDETSSTDLAQLDENILSGESNETSLASVQDTKYEFEGPPAQNNADKTNLKSEVPPTPSAPPPPLIASSLNGASGNAKNATPTELATTTPVTDASSASASHTTGETEDGESLSEAAEQTKVPEYKETGTPDPRSPTTAAVSKEKATPTVIQGSSTTEKPAPANEQLSDKGLTTLGDNLNDNAESELLAALGDNPAEKSNDINPLVANLVEQAKDNQPSGGENTTITRPLSSSTDGTNKAAHQTAALNTLLSEKLNNFSYNDNGMLNVDELDSSMKKLTNNELACAYLFNGIFHEKEGRENYNPSFIKDPSLRTKCTETVANPASNRCERYKCMYEALYDRNSPEETKNGARCIRSLLAFNEQIKISQAEDRSLEEIEKLWKSETSELAHIRAQRFITASMALDGPGAKVTPKLICQSFDLGKSEKFYEKLKNNVGCADSSSSSVKAEALASSILKTMEFTSTNSIFEKPTAFIDDIVANKEENDGDALVNAFLSKSIHGDCGLVKLACQHKLNRTYLEKFEDKSSNFYWAFKPALNQEGASCRLNNFINEGSSEASPPPEPHSESVTAPPT